MSTITVKPEYSAWLQTREVFEPESRRDNAAAIAQAIAQLMDPEWREFVAQEQLERRSRCGAKDSVDPPSG